MKTLIPHVSARRCHCLSVATAAATDNTRYWALFKPGNANVWNGLVSSSAGWGFRLAWRAGVGTNLTARMRKLFGTDDEVLVVEAVERCSDVFERIGAGWLPDDSAVGARTRHPACALQAALGLGKGTYVTQTHHARPHDDASRSRRHSKRRAARGWAAPSRVQRIWPLRHWQHPL